jgi:hypothetical protein
MERELEGEAISYLSSHINNIPLSKNLEEG